MAGKRSRSAARRSKVEGSPNLEVAKTLINIDSDESDEVEPSISSTSSGEKQNSREIKEAHQGSAGAVASAAPAAAISMSKKRGGMERSLRKSKEGELQTSSSGKMIKEPTAKRDEAPTAPGDDGAIDIVIPTALLGEQGAGSAPAAPSECTVLVQIDPDDAMVALDFHGASGAVGRFEADDEGVRMDLKGFQYSGTIHPGPTALIASLNKAGQLKIESITDEFVTLRKTRDVMAQLDAVVHGDMDAGYQIADDNVNLTERGGTKGGEKDGDNSSGKQPAGGKKRKGNVSTGRSGQPTKRRKTVSRKK